MTRQVIERGRLGVLSKIGQGGQGVVYRAPNAKTTFASSMVFKEYKAQALVGIDFTALAAMPALVEESLSYAEAERLVSMAAWPCAIVEDAGTPVGFVMPAIPQEFFISLTTVKGVSSSTAEFQHLLNDPTVLAARGITVDDVQRCTLLREVASGLAFLHKHGVCVGDISPKNVLFSLTPPEAMYFIDCDAVRINGVSALEQVETPGWEAPAGEDLATVYSDAYKLGLLALRLISGDQDTTNPAHLPSTTPGLLRQIITDTLSNAPHQRPLPEAWTYVLGNAIEEAQHQQLTSPAPAQAAPAPPPRPVVHSRPPVGHSGPPVSAPASAPASAPVGPPGPPMSAPSSSTSKIWAGVTLASVVIAALVAIIVTLANHTNRPSSSAPQTPDTQPTTNPANTATQTQTPTPTFVVPPNLLQGADQGDDSRCVNGYPLANGNRVGPAPPTSDGTFTSCGFAIEVGTAYWVGSPDPTVPKTVYSPSPYGSCLSVKANNPSVECSGADFVMHCAMEGADQWITCRGGNDAIIYIF